MSKKDSRQKETIKELVNYVGKYKIMVFASFIFATISSLLMLYIPILIGEAIDCIVSKGKVDYAGIMEVLKVMIVVILITAAAQWLMNVCNNHITYHVVQEMRMDAFAKIEILPLKYLDGHSHGELVSRVIADGEQVSEGLLLGFTQLFTGVITIVGTLWFMLSIQPQITLVVICITPVSLLIAGFIAKRTFSMFQEQSKARGEQTALVEEAIDNLKVVQAFGQEDNMLQKFDIINEKLGSFSLQAIFFSSITNPTTRFVNSLVYTAVGIVGAIFAATGRITVGQLASFLSYSNQYTKPFNEISGVVTELQNALACAGRMLELIHATPQIPEDENPTELVNVLGRVEWKDVAFSYDSKRKLIEGFHLSVKPGQRVAIVGPTGCGKTTLINLLMRFYDVDEGSISIDGIDIRNMTRKNLRSSIGMVLQDTWIREGSIADNIRIGKKDAPLEEVIEAAKASHAHSFIKRLPKGYDTLISEDGEGLSQGQKQLLCITRVMLALPPMLILDEATSSIDTRTEIKIQKAFGKMMQGRTSFIVAHRLSTIQEADIILVMKDGHIIEQGSHENLLESNGFYSKLYQSQFLNTKTAEE